MIRPPPPPRRFDHLAGVGNMISGALVDLFCQPAREQRCGADSVHALGPDRQHLTLAPRAPLRQ
ncbi:MAG: hypothetical protein IPQ07_39965 [Myxococcales bacterium]|nr:hypothetical protein [Myxococcales bacterium]